MNNTKLLWKLSIRIGGKRTYFYFTEHRLLQRFVKLHVMKIVDENNGYNCVSQIITTFGRWSTTTIKYIDPIYCLRKGVLE